MRNAAFGMTEFEVHAAAQKPGKGVVEDLKAALVSSCSGSGYASKKADVYNQALTTKLGVLLATFASLFTAHELVASPG